MKSTLAILWICCASWIPLSGQESIKSLQDLRDLSMENSTHVLIIFSGSDWCKPCIQLEKDILQSRDFEDYQKENLTIYKADFPYQKKNKPTGEIQKFNASLADNYNPDGVFPNVILLDSDLRPIAQIAYHHGMTTTEFIDQIKAEL